jgi:acetate kinase
LRRCISRIISRRSRRRRGCISRENQRIEPAERGGERAQIAADAIDEKIARPCRARVIAREQRPHVVAGIGDYATEVRRRVLEGASWLSVDLDAAANAVGDPRLTHPRVSAFVIPTNEDLMTRSRDVVRCLVFRHKRLNPDSVRI